MCVRGYFHRLHLHSFPTRRSSDLGEIVTAGGRVLAVTALGSTMKTARAHAYEAISQARSEEHTSELQSHHDLVCRLLLEKHTNAADPAADQPGDSHTLHRRDYDRG